MNRPLILVAEDEREIRELIVFSLQIAGFEVIAVPNGQEAVEKAVEVIPDLILLDVRMPRMNGLEACRALKQQAKTKDIPVVFLSAKGQAEDIKLGYEAGAEAYFLKPFAPEELPQRLIRVLSKLNTM
ncbi:MAG: response regulator [Anaerolineales bacterium]|nr:response regulator [Anaerolineales bacterium]